MSGELERSLRCGHQLFIIAEFPYDDEKNRRWISAFTTSETATLVSGLLRLQSQLPMILLSIPYHVSSKRSIWMPKHTRWLATTETGCQQIVARPHNAVNICRLAKKSDEAGSEPRSIGCHAHGCSMRACAAWLFRIGCPNTLGVNAAAAWSGPQTDQYGGITATVYPHDSRLIDEIMGRNPC